MFITAPPLITHHSLTLPSLFQVARQGLPAGHPHLALLGHLALREAAHHAGRLAGPLLGRYTPSAGLGARVAGHAGEVVAA